MYITKRGTILDHTIVNWFNKINTEGEPYNLKNLKFQKLSTMMVQNLLEEDKKYEINLAGTDKKDISIEVNDTYLEVLVKGGEHTYINFNKYQDTENITAEYKNGLLTISIPKKQKEKRVIEIKGE